MKHKGSCHCGNVAFEVEGEIDQGIACNCSICQRKGSLLWFVSKEAMKLLTPEDASKTYTFNEHKIKHEFCPNCGIHPYGEGADQEGNPVAAINLRCLEEVDLKAIPIHEIDGRSM